MTRTGCSSPPTGKCHQQPGSSVAAAQSLRTVQTTPTVTESPTASTPGKTPVDAEPGSTSHATGTTLKKPPPPKFPIAPIIKELTGIDVPDVNHNTKILCPFHQERHKSASISKYLFNCFGCEKQGDALSLLMEEEGLTFEAAITRATQLTGITSDPLPKSGWGSGVLSFE